MSVPPFVPAPSLRLTLAQVRTLADLMNAHDSAYFVEVQGDEYGVIVSLEHDDQRGGKWVSRWLIGVDGGKIGLPGEANEALTGP